MFCLADTGSSNYAGASEREQHENGCRHFSD